MTQTTKMAQITKWMTFGLLATSAALVGCHHSETAVESETTIESETTVKKEATIATVVEPTFYVGEVERNDSSSPVAAHGFDSEDLKRGDGSSLVAKSAPDLGEAKRDDDSSPVAAPTPDAEEVKRDDGNSTGAAPVLNAEKVKRHHANTPLTVLDISERDRDGRNALAVTLSVPLNPADDHQQYFSVSRSYAGVVDGSWVVGESGKVAWFPHTDPGVVYHVRVHPGLTAANGQKLAARESAKITTRSIQASVNFDTKGLFLTKGLGNGIPIVSINVEEVNIDFFRVEDRKVHGFLSNVHSRRSYDRSVTRLTGFAKLVHSARYDLEIPKNIRTKRSIPVGDVSALSKPGLYLAVMLRPGRYSGEQLLWFSVTDVGLHARFYEDRLDVHASSLTTGRALRNIEISLMEGNRVTLKRRTSALGRASFTGDYSTANLIVAKTNEHYSFVQIQRPALDLSEFDLGNRPQLPVELFVYTPRDLFRPGETVDFNALVRDGDGRQLSNGGAPVLQASIKRPDGTEVKSFRWHSQQQGYYHHSWPIPETAQTGRWTLTVGGPLKAPTIYTFGVEEFLPERMKLIFNPGNAEPIVSRADQDMRVPVQGEYLYGAPAAGNRLSTLVNVKHWRSPLGTLKNFEFGDINEANVIRNFELDDIKLDKAGKGTLKIPSNWRSTRSPLEVRMIGSLYETGGRPVTRVYSALVWPAAAMIGIRPDFKDGNPDANSRVAFDIVMADLKGGKLTAKDVEVVLIREDRRYFWVYDSYQGWHYEWSDKEYPEFSQTVDITAGSHTSVEMPVDWGSYRLEVKDSSGLKSSLRFFAGHNWYADWKNVQTGVQAARPDKIAMALDREHYEPGQTAKLKLVPPEPGEALVVVEAHKPLWMRRISLPAEGATVEIPIGDWNQHNIYVSAIALRPGSEKETITPKRSFGLIHLPLNRTNRKLLVEFTTPAKMLPDRILDTTFHVTQADGGALPDRIHATLAAVDEGVLSINNFATPDPFKTFFGQRRYSPESRDVYNQVIDVSGARNAKFRFGGDTDVAKGGKPPPSDVQIVSLFSGLVDVGKDGRGAVPLRIPDFNGRLRLMATVFSDDRFGSGEREITVAEPVVTQLARPRFLATGDKATIALDINNLSGDAQSLQVAVSGAGPIKLDATTTAIELADKEKTTLTYAVEATGGHGRGTIELSVIGPDIEPVAKQWTLGVRPPHPALVKQNRQLLKPGAEYTLDPGDIEAMLPETVDAVLSVSSRANLSLRQRLRQLLQYPYGCLEQTSSRVLPLIHANAQKQAQFNLTRIDEDERLRLIEKGMDRIATMQLANGAFGLWSNKSPEEHWLTAFVVDILLQARDMGIDVPQAMLERALQRLREYVDRNSRFLGERWSEAPDHYTFAYKAYAAYVLSKVNQAPLGSLRTLFDHHFEDAKSALPKLHLGLALESMGDKRRAEQAIDSALAHDHEQTRQQYYGDYGSRERDLALIMHLLIKHDVRVNEAVALSFSLADLAHKRKRLSTQEGSALFLAGASLEAVQGNQWQATLAVGDTSTALEQANTFYRRLGGEDIARGLLLKSRSEAPLFVSTDISGYGTRTPEVVANGMSVVRAWYDLDGRKIDPTKLKVGELSIVHLEVGADERTPDALLIDLLPAGLEIENQNLDQAVKLEEFAFDGKSLRELTRGTTIKHQEFRDDRYVAALDVGRYRRSNVFYLVRAVTPGEYKVPASLVEDMYRPERRVVGATLDTIIVENTAE